MRWAALSGIVLCLWAAAAHGWGNAGHQIVCAMAWDEMTPPARAMVGRLLGSEDAFVRGCTWADEARGDPRYDWIKPQHFVNIPPRAAFSARRDCPPAGCVVRALAQQARTVVSPGVADSQRAEALQLLAHFVGDIHQPLHVSHAADRGGNAIAIELCDPACRRTDLHAVWDNDLVDAGGSDWRRHAAALRAAISETERRSWRTLDLDGWTAESFALAEDRAYRPVVHGVPGGGSIGDLAQPVHLARSYVRAMRPTVDMQLQKAAVRLAAALDALAAGSVPPSWNGVPVFHVRAAADGHDALPVHASPSPSSRRVGSIAPGAQAEVVGLLEDSVRVRLPNGREGYVTKAQVIIE